MADATKESEAWNALRRYLMLKAVLIKPVRGGGGHRNRNTNLTEKLMTSFYKGKDEVWHIAKEIEKGRQEKKEPKKTIHRKRDLEGNVIERPSSKKEVKRRGDRAKTLTNDGELRKAFATMVQRGVAPTTNDIVKQLRTKFPKRKNEVSWPSQDEVEKLRTLIEKTAVSMEVDGCEGDEKESVLKPEITVPESLLKLRNSIKNDFQAVQVQWIS